MKTDLRYEVKYMAYQAALPQVLGWLESSRFAFCEAFPSRRINSVYFDTIDNRGFADNEDGISRRQKVRYRWYGESVVPLSGALEIKNRKNAKGWKRICPTEGFFFESGWSWDEFSKCLEDQVTSEFSEALSEYSEPKSIISYDRMYFVSADQHVRVTVDQNLHFFQQDSQIEPNFTRFSSANDLVVVEVKCPELFREQASQVVKDIPLRSSRCSKYVLSSYYT